MIYVDYITLLLGITIWTLLIRLIQTWRVTYQNIIFKVKV